jgi:hypothetical protein
VIVMGLWEKLRRPDWLAEMQALVMVGLVVVGLGIVLSAGWAITSGGPVVAEVPADSLSNVVGSVDGLNRHAAITPDATVEVEIADPSTRQLVASALTSLPTGLVVVAMLAMLLRIVRRARRDDPFTAGAVRRLRILAVVVLVGGSLAGLAESLAALDLAISLTDQAWTTVRFPVAWLLAGFGLLAISEIVKRGTAMRAELDTVVCCRRNRSTGSRYTSMLCWKSAA